MLKNNENSSSISDDITKVIIDESTEEEIEDDEPAGFPTGVENRWGAVPSPLGGGLSKFDNMKPSEYFFLQIPRDIFINYLEH